MVLPAIVAPGVLGLLEPAAEVVGLSTDVDVAASFDVVAPPAGAVLIGTGAEVTIVGPDGVVVGATFAAVVTVGAGRLVLPTVEVVEPSSPHPAISSRPRSPTTATRRQDIAPSLAARSPRSRLNAWAQRATGRSRRARRSARRVR